MNADLYIANKMLSNQCFTLKNLGPKSQVRLLSKVRCWSKEQQQTFNRVYCLRQNNEAMRCITTIVQYNPIELIEKGDYLLKNVYAGSCFCSGRTIHISPTSYQKTNQDEEKRKNYIFIGVIFLMVVAYIVISLSVEEHADYVIVK